ncbi:MAG: histidinol dehydrogenase [bacterium]
MKKYYFKQLDKNGIERLCQRPAINFTSVSNVVKEILSNVKQNGDNALKNYTKKFDGAELENLLVKKEEVDNAVARISPEIKKSFEVAVANIEKFHRSQIRETELIETTKGVTCFRETRAIEKVGLYIPGGTAPLPSTVLMLGIPAKIAGCKEVILCTPPQKDGSVPDIILYTAQLCGITKIFKVGGAQAVAAMAYGTESIPKVYKIFGPGNQYVTAAKMLVSIEPDGVAIDMPAGPSEVLVVADKEARADFVASDLLSQAEHGVDSQAVLVCNDEQKTDEILIEVEKQLNKLSRKEIAKQSLENSFALIVENIKEAIEFSNAYAPEHLILNIADADLRLKEIINAGSVFIGQYSCESAGDYASGTNHTLPTYGYARMYSGVSVDSFVKQITFQKLSKEGVKNLGPIVSLMAGVEGLDGHRRAVEIRGK